MTVIVCMTSTAAHNLAAGGFLLLGLLAWSAVVVCIADAAKRRKP